MNRETWLHILAIVATASIVFFTSLGQSRLWDRDEPRNAGCAAEMMERGDLIVPIFNDELRHQKPVLLYWLTISAYSLFGVNEFAARFWSALLATGSAILTYGIARRLFDSSIALLSAIALCSSIMFCVAARAATPDSTLIFFSTLGIFFYVFGTFAANHDGDTVLKNQGSWFPQNIWYVVAMNVAFAFATLTKGPVGIFIPTAIIGMFLLIQRMPEPQTQPENSTDRIGHLSNFIFSISKIVNPIHFLKTCWYMRPITAIGILMLVASPWYIAVHFQTNGDFSQLFFLNENFARATTAMENHSGNWFYYPATIAVGFFPWSVFLAPVFCAVDQQISQRTKSCPAIVFLVCWVAVQVGLFSIAETKLPSYVTPCYPALAILTSFCLLRWIPQMAETGMRWQFAALTTFVVAGVFTTAGLAIASSKFFPEIWWISSLGLIPIVGGIASIYLLWQRPFRYSLLATTTTAILFCVFMFGIGTVAVDSTKQSDQLLSVVKSSKSDSVAAYHCLESSWVFYAEKPIFELHRGPQTKESSSSLVRNAFWKRKPVVHPELFVANHPDAMIITTDEHVDELLNRLPEGFHAVKQTPFFLKDDRKLVLVKRDNEVVASSSQNSLR